jgi:hypothetical protein
MYIFGGVSQYYLTLYVFDPLGMLKQIKPTKTKTNLVVSKYR